MRGVTHRLFAVERYERSGHGEVPDLGPLPAAADTRLVVAVHLPADEVVLALVEGPDTQTVADSAAAAGWRVDRLNPAVWVRPPASDFPTMDRQSATDEEGT